MFFASPRLKQFWPNNAAGWGRAAITDTLGLTGNQTIWLLDQPAGLTQGGSATYSLNVSAGAPLRISLPATTAAEPVTAIILSVVIFHEALRTGPGALAAEVGGLAMMVLGIVVLGRSPFLGKPETYAPRRRV